MPRQKLKAVVEFSKRLTSLVDFAESAAVPASLRTKLEALVLDAARLEIQLRDQVDRPEGGPGQIETLSEYRRIRSG